MIKLVYIAGPYRGNGTPDCIHKNIQAARTVAKKYWQKGYAVICPHMNSAYMDGACLDEMFLNGAIEILKRCDGIVMMPNWQQSEGSRNELNVADKLGLEIIYEEEL